jgi:hypothetical protein
MMIVMILLVMMVSSTNSQQTKPVSKDTQLTKNKFNTRTAVEVQDVLFGTDATGFQPSSPCKHNIDIVWTAEVGSSIYQTPTITYLNGKSSHKDIVVPTFVRYVEVLHGPTGNEKHSSDGEAVWPFSHSKFVSHSSALMYDIDGDHEQEIVMATANGEVAFLKSTGQLLREKAIKLLPLKLDKHWYEGLNDETMDISMNLSGGRKKKKKESYDFNEEIAADNKKKTTADRKLLQIITDDPSEQMPAGIEGTLSAEAKESMKVCIVFAGNRQILTTL